MEAEGRWRLGEVEAEGRWADCRSAAGRNDSLAVRVTYSLIQGQTHTNKHTHSAVLCFALLSPSRARSLSYADSSSTQRQQAISQPNTPDQNVMHPLTVFLGTLEFHFLLLF